MTTIWRQNATDTLVLLVQEDRSPKSGCGQGWFLPEAGRGNPFQACVPAAAGCQPSLACGHFPSISVPIWRSPSSLCFSVSPPQDLSVGPSRIVSAETLFANTRSHRRFWVAVTSGGCSFMHCRRPSSHSLLQLPLLQVSAIPQGLLGSFPVPSGRTQRQTESPEMTRAGSLRRDGILHCARVPAENTSPERLRGDSGLDGRGNEMVREEPGFMRARTVPNPLGTVLGKEKALTRCLLPHQRGPRKPQRSSFQ